MKRFVKIRTIMESAPPAWAGGSWIESCQRKTHPLTQVVLTELPYQVRGYAARCAVWLRPTGLGF